MILYQAVVAGDQKYSFQNQQDLTIFDIHNDSPYNMGVSFGSDTGIQGAEYFTSPHSILFGISPVYAAQRSIGGAKFNGTIYLYTQTPLGGGVTNLGSAPAQQITVIGYQTGYQPKGTTSLNRMTNTGNVVNTLGGVANSVQNDANAVGTNVVEATPTGYAGSAVSLLNQGVLQLGANVSAESGMITLLDALGSSKNGVWQGGQITLPLGIIANLIKSQAANDLGLSVPLGNRVVDSVNNVTMFQVNGNGASIINGTLGLLVGSISRIIRFTAAVTTTPTFFNHGLGVVPDFVVCVPDGAAAGTFSCIVDYSSMTTTQAKLTGSASFTAECLAIKF